MVRKEQVLVKKKPDVGREGSNQDYIKNTYLTGILEFLFEPTKTKY